MKKLIGLSFIGLLIVALSAPVYAQLEFKASGMIDTNWMEYRNFNWLSGSPDSGISNAAIWGGVPIVGTTSTPALNPSGNIQRPAGAAFNKQTSWLNTRGMLKFDAAMGKDVSMTTYFEMDSTRWGERGVGRNNAGDWQTDSAAVEIKHLYLDVGIPYFGVPVPMTVRIGMQGEYVRNAMFVSNDGPGITLGMKMDPVTISPFWFKMLHAGTGSVSYTATRDFSYSDDNDVFGIQGNAAIGKITVGGYGVFYDMRTYPLTATTSTYGISPSFKARMYWFGGYADGKLGPLNMKADFVYDYGKVKPFGASQAYPDVKYEGYAARLAFVYPWELFEFGLLGAYGSGSDANRTSSSGLPGSRVADRSSAPGGFSTKVGSYVIPPGSEEPPAFGENGIAIYYQSPILGRQPDFSTDSRFQLTRGAIGGSWFTRGHVAYKIAPWYKITLLGAYIGDTTKHGNTNGSARKADGVTLRDDKTIGWEVGLYNEFQVYKNVTFGVVGSWLFAKKALEYWKPDDPNSITTTTPGRNVSGKDPYVVGTALKYTW